MGHEMVSITKVIIEFIIDFCGVENVAAVAIGEQLLFIEKKATVKELNEAEQQWMEQPMTWNKQYAEYMCNMLAGEIAPVVYFGNDGIVKIKYRQSVNLDFQDPNFFDQLELVLDHVLKQDDLSLFSLPIENASCSIHCSQDCEHDPL